MDGRHGDASGGAGHHDLGRDRRQGSRAERGSEVTVAGDATARFKVGDQVRIRVGVPPTHFRTPEYIQGKQGMIDTLWGAFPNPESLAYGGDGLPAQPLYQVAFAQTDLWRDYKGPATDTLLIDIYENWLENI
ncbi:MAG: nitrile hydratase subunit beta [Chloroflexi bacterium]|nr:nitrile hydratase subunit beta [Chloroflexota bacterium]